MPGELWAVVPAGGSGSRMQADKPKQYLQLAGQSVIEHTLGRLRRCPSVAKVVVGIADGDPYWPNLGLDELTTVTAGAERVDTVASCLAYIEQQGGADDWVLVHDAARPCVRIDEIEMLLESVIGTADGGILALPVSDTIKRAKPDDSAYINETVPRELLWRAMTPQLFKVGELLTAIKQAAKRGVQVTDEASAMEASGYRVRLVGCSPDNIKITLPQDIRFAEMILAAQLEEYA